MIFEILSLYQVLTECFLSQGTQKKAFWVIKVSWHPPVMSSDTTVISAIVGTLHGYEHMLLPLEWWTIFPSDGQMRINHENWNHDLSSENKMSYVSTTCFSLLQAFIKNSKKSMPSYRECVQHLKCGNTHLIYSIA